MARPDRVRSAAAPLLAALISLALSVTVSAPAPAAEAVDFPAAFDRALRNNALVSVSAEDLFAARKDAEMARGFLLPSLRFDEKFIRTSVPGEAFALKMNQKKLLASDFLDVANFNSPPPRNDFLGVLALDQPLFAPKAYFGYAMARKETDAKFLDLSRKKEEVAYRVLTAYLTVLSAKRFSTVAEQALSDAREHLRVAQSLESAGMGLSSDVLRAKVFLASAEGAKVTADSRLEIARRGFALSMGEPWAAPVDASGVLPAFPDPGTIEERIAAVSRRADLRAFSLRVANADRNVRLQKSEYLPTVGVSGAYEVDGESTPFSPDNRTWKVGVGLTWNLFDGFRREASVAKAASERRRAGDAYRGLRDAAAFQVAQAYLGVREATRREEIARASLASAEEGVRLVNARYENHLGRMVDLLDAQTALNAARADSVRAENDVRQSRAQLLYASGGLLEWALSVEKETGR